MIQFLHHLCHFEVFSPLQSQAFSGQVFSSSNISLNNYSRVPYTSVISILEVSYFSLSIAQSCSVFQWLLVERKMAIQATKKPHAIGMLWKDLLHLYQKLNVLCYWYLLSSRIVTLPKTVEKQKTRMKTKQNPEVLHTQAPHQGRS